MDCQYLFVYGTLRSDAAAHSSMTLEGMGTRVAAASVAGLLYQVGATYPGAVFTTGAGSLIRGEVWQLDDPEVSFPILDRYEEAAPLVPVEHAEYERRLISIARWHAPARDGLPQHAWAYEYRPTLLHPSIPRIDSGDFLHSLRPLREEE